MRVRVRRSLGLGQLVSSTQGPPRLGVLHFHQDGERAGFFRAGVSEDRLSQGRELGGELRSRWVKFLHLRQKLFGFGLFGNPSFRFLLSARRPADDGVYDELLGDLMAYEVSLACCCCLQHRHAPGPPQRSRGQNALGVPRTFSLSRQPR